MKVTREEAYAVLGLDADANEAQVKASFKRLALKYHPDKNGGCQDSAEQFKKISAAYARLTSDHQSDDELDEEAMRNFHAQVFEQMFGDAGFGLFMQEMLSGMTAGFHPRRRARHVPRTYVHRSAAGSRPRGFPVRPSHNVNGPAGVRLGGGMPFMAAGGMPFMFDMQFAGGYNDDDSSSSGWETDDGSEAAAASRPQGQQRQSESEESSEWETDHGSDDEMATAAGTGASTSQQQQQQEHRSSSQPQQQQQAHQQQQRQQSTDKSKERQQGQRGPNLPRRPGGNRH